MLEAIKLDIVGIPKPRMVKSDSWKRRDCVLRYWDYKERLLKVWGDRELPHTFHVIFIMPMPKSWSKKEKLLMDGKPHQTKPDGDNMLKGLQDVLLKEDSHLWDVRVTKLWGVVGSIEIRELEPFKVE